MEEILRWTTEILKWPGGVEAKGLLGGTRAMFRWMGGFLTQIKERLRRTRGCGAELGVFGPTKDVAADRGGEIFLYKGKNPSFNSLFYFEHPNCLLLTNCGCRMLGSRVDPFEGPDFLNKILLL